MGGSLERFVREEEERTPRGPLSLDAIRQLDDEARGIPPSGTLAATMRVAKRDGTPAQAAEAFALGRLTSVPPTVALRSLDTLRQQTTPQFDADGFARQYPATARWLAADTARAALAQDEVESLGFLERLSRSKFVQEFGGAMAGPTSPALKAPTPLPRGILSAEWRRGSLMAERSRLGFLPIDERQQPAVQARLREIDEALAQPLPEAEGFAQFVRGTTAQLPGMTAAALEGGAGAMLGGVLGGLAGLGMAGPVGVLPGVSAGAKVGGAFFAANEMAKQIGGQTILSLEADGVPPVIADVAGRTSGWLGSAVEFSNTGILLQPIRKYLPSAGAAALVNPTTRRALVDAVKYWGKSVGSEVLEENVQQGIDAIVSRSARSASGLENRDLTLDDVMASIGETTAQTFVAMALLPLPGTALIGVDGLARAQVATQRVEGLKAAVERARQMVVREANPDGLAELVKDAGGEQLVGIDVDRVSVLLQEAGVTPEEFVKLAGITMTQWQQASELTGTDLLIPVESLLTNLAPLPLAEAMLPDLRFTPDAMTGREAEAALSDVVAFRERVAKEAEAVGEIGEADPAWRIVEDLRAKLEAAGAYTPEQVMFQAQTAAKFYAVMARAIASKNPENPLADPWTLYSRKGGLGVLGGQRAEAIFDAEMAVARARRQGLTQEEVDALRERVTKLADERVAIRAVLEEADQVQDVRDEAGRLRQNLRHVSTDALVQEYIRLREIAGQATQELTELETGISVAEAESGAATNAKELAGLIEEAGLADRVTGYADAETWAAKQAAYLRYVRGLRGQVRKVERSVPRLGRELEARGIENPDQYAHENGLGGTFAVPSADVPFQSRTLAQSMDGVEMLLQAAFHGSPYVFDRFSLSAIGTGEGAQAYGWGLYFAQSRDVAEGYRKTLSRQMLDIHKIAREVVGTDWDYAAVRDLAFIADNANIADYSTPEKAARQLVAQNSSLRPDNSKSLSQYAMEYASIVASVRERIAAESGALYRVEIPDEAVARMLDWDKPLSAEHAAVFRDVVGNVRVAEKVGGRFRLEYERKGQWIPLTDYTDFRTRQEADAALETLFEEDTGGEAYKALAATFNDAQRDASLALLSAGIPGIKYLDAGSRATAWQVTLATSKNPNYASSRFDSKVAADQYAAEKRAEGFTVMIEDVGTRNLVVFDENLVTITERNGQPVTPQQRADFLAQEQTTRVGAEVTTEVTAEDDAAYADATSKRDFRTARRILERVLGIQSVDSRGGVEREGEGQHQPTGPGFGAQGHDLTTLYPDDVYSTNGARYYGTGDDAMDRAAWNVAMEMREKPSATVTVYRAVPKSVTGGLRVGDWVTTVRAYAKQHGESTLLGDYRIISQKVKAQDIFTDADSLLEWGYFPQEGRFKRGISFTGPSDDRTPRTLRQVVDIYNRSPQLLRQGERRRPNAYYLRTQRVIGLMQGANLSSFLHEMAHDYLATLELVATDPDAPAWVVRDFETAMRVIGVKDEDRVAFVQYLRTGQGRTNKETKAFVKAEERWARSFESYLEKGEAPSRDLVRAFATFRVWLGQVYRKVKAMLVPVNPELREVFDRMLATDEEIAEYRQQPTARPLFTERPETMTDAQWAAYRESFETNTALQGAALVKQLMAETRRAVSAEWAGRRETVEAEIRSDLADDPLVQAVAFLRGEGGEPMRLNRALLDDVSPDLWKSLPKGTTAKDGPMDLGAVALRFGYPDVETLVADLQRYEETDRVVARRLSETFKRSYGDLLGDSTAMADAVSDAVHRAESDAPLVTELKALGRQLGMRVADKPVLTQVARDMLAAMRVADILPSRYENAEMREARSAEQAVRDGMPEVAAFHKRRQLLNRILVRESRDVLAEAERVRAFAVRMGGETAQARLARAGTVFTDAMASVLGEYEFAQVSRKRLSRREALREYAKKVKEEGGVPPMLDPALLSDAEAVNYRTLTMAELRGVGDAMRQIYHHATTIDTMAKEGRRVEMAKVEEGLVASLERNRPEVAERLDDYAWSPAALRETLKAVDAWHLPPTFLLRWLDGDAHGAMWQTFQGAINDAAGQESDRLREAAKRIEAIEKMVDWTPALLDRPKRYDGIRTPMSKRAILALASNWGNRSSREAMVNATTASGGRQFGSATAIERMFAETMTAKDWAYVQARWDFINEFWPEIAEQERRLSGIVPEKIEAEGFTIRTADGTDVAVRGGYYPLSYDRSKGRGRGREQALAHVSEAAALGLTENLGARTVTRHGWTNERVEGHGRPVNLSLDVMGRHVAAVIHDLTHREVIRDLSSLLSRPALRQAVAQRAGLQYYDALQLWLRRVANPTMLQQPASPVERILALARTGTTVVNLGLKYTTGVAQTLGFLQSIDAIGPKWMAVGLAESGVSAGTFATGRTPKAFTLVIESSAMMRERLTSGGGERDLIDRKRSRLGKLTDLDKFSFLFVSAMDGLVSVPTWIGAYRKAMAESTLEPAEAHAAAVRYADDIVESTQAAGATKDLAAIQGGPELQRMLTMHYTAFSRMYGQFRRAVSNVRHGKWSVPRFLASMTLLWFGQVVLGELLAGRMPDPEDEREREAFWWKVAMFPSQLFVLGRNVGSAIGPGAWDFELSPAERAFEVTAKAASAVYRETLGDLWYGEDRALTDAEIKNLLVAPGYWLRLPTAAMFQYADYLLDWQAGRVAPETANDVYRGLLLNRR